MSVYDLPVRVDVSITPGCCWCSLLLFEVSAAAGCLALWFRDRKNIPTLSPNRDISDTCCCFDCIDLFDFKDDIRKGSTSHCVLSLPFFLTLKGNKGGVSARMTMFGHPVCFLNCHLPAHMRNLEQRMEDFESILQQQQFDGGTATGVLDHEWVMHTVTQQS